jgi:hypothetical protein
MKTIFAVVGALAALSGCAVQQPYYTTAQVQDPYQWRTVSVTPSNRAPGSAPTTVYTTEELPAPSSRVVYAQPTTTTTYIVAPPVYYAPAPVYYQPAPSYYYPPVSIGLDFSFGRYWGGHRGGWGGRGGWGRGGYRR